MRINGRLPDLIGVSGALIGLIVISVALAIDDGGTLGDELLESVSTIGASRVALATVIAIAVLGFMALGRRRGVLGLAMALVVGVGIYTSPRYDEWTYYPPRWGVERQSLEELAEESPNSNISSELAGIIRLGDVLGDARLLVPSDGPMARLRAFTDLDAEFAVPPQMEKGFWPVRKLAIYGEERLFLVGDGADEVYYWVDTPEGVYIVPGSMLRTS